MPCPKDRGTLFPPPNLTCLWHTAGYFRLGFTPLTIFNSTHVLARFFSGTWLAIIAPTLEPLWLSVHTCANCANLGDNLYAEYTYMDSDIASTRLHMLVIRQGSRLI
jgi:hypothetical protein